MVQILECAFTGYPVTDLARARKFYEEVLQLKPSMVYEDGGKGWIEYEIAGSTFALAAVNPAWTPSEQGPCSAFEVEDFDACIAKLRAAGHRFRSEPMSFPSCQLAVVIDTEGNAVAIHKRQQS